MLGMGRTLLRGHTPFILAGMEIRGQTPFSGPLFLWPAAGLCRDFAVESSRYIGSVFRTGDQDALSCGGANFFIDYASVDTVRLFVE